MGLEADYLHFIEQQCELIGGLKGKEMLELGDQTIAPEAIPERTGKEYFENRGVRHTSFDLNGANGAIRIDLSRPIDRSSGLGLGSDARWLDKFDIVTNAGTTEHVEPHEAQYECFKNIHRCLRVGGIAVHIVPDVDELEAHGHWKGHCNNYYSQPFFEMLSQANSYEILSSRVIAGNRVVSLRKTRECPFMTDRSSFLALVARRSGGILYPGINDRFLPWPLRRAVMSLLDTSRPLRLRLGIHRGGLRAILNRILPGSSD